MSVKNDKTLVKVRTFAQDFKDHAPEGETLPAQVTPVSSTPVKKQSVVIQKSGEKTAPKAVAQANTQEERTSVPLFDELQKEANASLEIKREVPRTYKKSVVVKKKPAPVRKQSYDQEATVITAKKKSEGRATSRSLFKGLSDWLHELQKQSQKKKSPTYVVGGADRRRGVIEKATTKSGAIFTADNETLQEEILRRRGAMHQHAQVTWTPNTDVGYNLLESPAEVVEPKTQQVEVTFKQKTLPEPAIVEPYDSWKYQVPDDVPPEVPTYEPVDTPISIEENPPVAQSQSYVPEPEFVYIGEPTASEKPFGTGLIPDVGPYDDSEPKPIISMEDIEPLFRGEFSKLSTNIIALLAVTIIALSVVAVVAVNGLYSWITTDSETVTLEPNTSLVTNGVATDVLLQDSTSLGLRTAIDQIDSLAIVPLQEFRFLETQTSVLSPQTIISWLDFDTHPNFTQTVSTIHFLVIDNVQHAIILRVNDPITALGSMYNWEPRMQDDLANLLNSKDTPEEATSFVDETINGHDVRVMTDGIDEVMVYGFVADNIILITKTTDSFARVTGGQ
jgi:guanyl-specific ribonuclease Sa